MSELSTKEKLMIEGMEELRLYGINGFSLRRVAKNCGISCAAPYKHFENKQEFLAATAQYIHEKWEERVRDNMSLVKPVEMLIADLAADSVDVLTSNPNYRTVLLVNDSNGQNVAKSITMCTAIKRLYVIYRRKYNISRDQLRSLIFSVNSLIYGATLIIDVEGTGKEDGLEVVRRGVLFALKNETNS